MDGDALHGVLAGSRFADLRWVARTGSTNADLIEAARRGAAEGTVVVADDQTAGRGRLDRTWEAPAGSSLLVSVLLRPEMPSDRVQLVTMAVGIAAAEACAARASVPVGLKWPNDLVLVGQPRFEGRKLGGILAEAVVEADRLRAVVVGLGLNVNWPEPLPAALEAIAVSLNHAVGAVLDRTALLLEFLARLERWYQPLVDGGDAGAAGVLARYRELSATIGRQVRAELAGTQIVGEAVGITDSGHLRVRPRSGPEIEIAAADVVHLRPATA